MTGTSETRRSRMLGALLVTALVVSLTLAGCSQGPTAAEKKTTCFGNEARVEAVMKLFKADSGMDAPLDKVLKDTGAVCPSGGTYTWDPATSVLTCSVHGHP